MSITLARSHLANEVKRSKRMPDPDSQARVADARRELIAAKLEAHIRAVVASSPPLTEEQKLQLSTLLRDGRPVA